MRGPTTKITSLRGNRIAAAPKYRRGHDRAHERRRIALAGMARPPPDEPARSGDRRGGLAAPLELRGNGTRGPEPRDGAHPRPRAGGPRAGAQRHADGGGVRPALPRDEPRRPADGGDTARARPLAQAERPVLRLALDRRWDIVMCNAA